MPLNYEEIVIRVLTDSSKAINDLKKVDKAIDDVGKKSTLSAKSIVSLAGAFGGVNLALELGVKAITSYIKQVKELEKAYVDSAKAMEGYSNSALKAYNRLETSQKKLNEALGKELLTNKEIRNNRNADINDNQRALIELASITDIYLQKNLQNFQQYEQALRNAKIETLDFAVSVRQAIAEGEKLTDGWLARDRGAPKAGTPSVVAPAPATAAKTPPGYKDEQARVQAMMYELGLLNKIESAEMRRNELLAKYKTYYADLNVDVTKAVDAYLAIETADQARLDMLAEIQKASEAESIAIEKKNAQLRNQFIFEEELARIKKENSDKALAQMEKERAMALSVAQSSLQGWQATFAAIGNLVSSRYQAEIDAAEEGSDVQKALMKEQWEAEKKYAIAKAAIDIAAGVLANLKTWWMIPFVLATGAFQIAALKATKAPTFATGTPPGGYVVPEGYSNDNFPVQARSGERVTVTPPGSQGSGQQTVILQLNGRELGRAVTKMFDRRQALVPTGAIV